MILSNAYFALISDAPELIEHNDWVCDCSESDCGCYILKESDHDGDIFFESGLDLQKVTRIARAE